MSVSPGSRQRTVGPALGLFLFIAGGCATSLEEVRDRGSRCVESELRADLESDSSWIRREAALALGSCGAQPARPALESMLAAVDEKHWVRSAAAAALGRLSNPASIPLLVGLASQAGLEPEIQVELIGALERLAVHDDDVCTAVAALIGADDLLVSGRASLAVERACGGCEEGSACAG